MLLEPEYLIFPSEKPCVIRIKPTEKYTVLPTDREYKLRAAAFTGLRNYSYKKEGRSFPEKGVDFLKNGAPLKLENNELTATVVFPQEDRYLLFVDLLNSETGERETFADIEVYALEEDLFALLPLRGDFHCHSIGSDGTFAPETMVASGVGRGYDFMAVTDHFTQEPSVKAQKSINPLNCGVTVIRGEEVQVGGCHLHLLSLGGEKSLNSWFANDRDDFNAAVDKKRYIVEDSPLNPVDKNAAAVALAVFERTKEWGGTSVIAHPLWLINDGFVYSEDLLTFLFDHRTFDALELFSGGASLEGSHLQLCMYRDMEKIPVIGNSDSHYTYGERPLLEYYTMVFSPDASEKSICDSIKEGRTLVVDRERIFGSYRLAKYAYFLRDKVFPAHDVVSARLSKVMMRYSESGCNYEKYAAEFKKVKNPVDVLKNAFYR